MSAKLDFLVGVAVGGAIGAAAALLYAPQSGAETRQQLKDKTNQALDKSSEMAQQAKGRANELISQTQTKLGDVTTQAKTKMGDLSNQAQEMIDKGRGMVDQQTAAVRSAIDAAGQAYRDKSQELKAEVQEDTQPMSVGA